MSLYLSMRLEHLNGSASAAGVRLSGSKKGFRIRIRNLDASNSLGISFSAGREFFLLAPGEELAEDANFHYFFLRAVTGGDAELAAVDVATAAALPAYVQAGAGLGATLTAAGVGILTVDGVATVLGDRILVKDGAAGADNGIYEVTTEGTAGAAFVLTRATDHDVDAEVTSLDSVSVAGGPVNGGLTFQITTADPITVDTTAVVWAEMAATYASLLAVG